MSYKVLLSEVYIGTMIQAAKDIGVEVIASQETGGFGSSIQRHNWPDVRVIPNRSSWLEKTELPGNSRWFMAAQPPCFTAGTLVHTKRGAVAIDDVKVGDEVLTHKGRWRKVYDTMKRWHRGDVYDFESPMARGSVVTCTGEHPFWQQGDQFSDMRDVDARKLNMNLPFPVGEQLVVPDTQHSSSSWATNPTFWWIAGLWMADGHMRKLRTNHKVANSREIYIATNKEQSPYVLARVQEIFPGARVDRDGPGKSQRIVFGSRVLGELLSDCGKEHDKRVPTWLWSGSIELQTAFMEGYLYGDGRQRGGESSSCSYQLSHELATLHMKLTGQPASLKLRVGRGEMLHDFKDGKGLRKIVSRDSWYVNYTQDTDKSRVTMNQYEFVARENMMVHSDRIEVKPKILKREDSVMVYNISVEEDESYMAGGVMTHNCAGGSMVTPGHSRGGLDNPKSAFKVTKAYLEYAYAQKPPIIVIESVPGTLKICGDDICRIRDEFGPDYGVAFVLDNSSHYGCVSLRKRLWHVHYRKDLFLNGLSWTHLAATSRTMEDVLRDLPEEEGHGVSASQINTYDRFKNLWPAMPQGEYANQFLRKSGRWDLVPSETVKMKQSGEPYVFYESIAAYRTGYKHTVPTITSSTLLIHPDGTRPLTTREYLRVNGMPDSFSFDSATPHSKHLTFIGKTVSLGICKWVFQNVIDNLKSLEVKA